MKLRFFTIPVYETAQGEEAVNQFLSAHRIVSVEKNFVNDGMQSAWSICIGYTDAQEKLPVKKGKVDYREVLDAQDFRVFAELRSLRKELAENEGVPAYALFTNEQLAVMVQNRIASKGELEKIEGVGAMRVQKYGDRFLSLLQAQWAKIKDISTGAEDAKTQPG